MFLIFIHVRKVENKRLKYKFRSKANSSPSASTSTSRSSIFYLFSRKGDSSKKENPTQRRKSNRTKSRRKSQASYTARVAHQAYFFLGAYFITWTPVTLVRLLQIFG